MENFISYGNYGFTTRNCGFSTGSYKSNNMGLYTNDDVENVIKNREKLASDIGFKLDDFVTSSQTHSCNYYRVKKSDKGRGAYDMDSSIKNNDALYTFENGIVLASYHADCTPVFFFSKKHNLIGVIHAGWLGTAREVTYKTLKHIIDEYNVSPMDLCVHIGPSISSEVYEVQQDVVDQMPNYHDAFTFKNNQIFLDTAYANKLQIEKLGIRDILHDNRCTYKNDDLFFSHRREANTGRMMAFIYQ